MRRHILQSLTDQHSEVTLVSTDGIGSVRSDLPELDVGRPHEEGEGRSDPPVCPVLSWEPVYVLVVGRDGHFLHHGQGKVVAERAGVRLS